MFGTEGAPGAPSPESGGYWPNGARLAVSLSLDVRGRRPADLRRRWRYPRSNREGLPDLPTNAFFAIRRLRGRAARPRPDGQARHQAQLVHDRPGPSRRRRTSRSEIVKRGHEAAAHGRTWQNSYLRSEGRAESSSPTASKRSRRSPASSRSAGTPTGCATLRAHARHPCRIARLQVSHRRAEPWTSRSSCRYGASDFVTVPYTFHMNDIVSFPFEGWNPAAYEQALKDEFDQLYEEGAKRRRMMVISCMIASPAMPGGCAPSTGSSPTPKARTASGSPVRTRSLATRSPIGAPPPSLTVVRQTLPVCRDQRRDEGEFRQLERCTSCVNC